MRHGWSLNRDRWLEVMDLMPQEWRKVPFREIHASMVPNGAGIYVVCACGPSVAGVENKLFKTIYNALYVGKSTDIRRRFLQHCRQPQAEVIKVRQCFPSAEFWFTGLPAEEIAAAEDSLIDCLGPPANQRRGIKATLQPPEQI